LLSRSLWLVLILLQHPRLVAVAFFVVGFDFVAASAMWRWRAGVAPVRGGTYFLCRRKESKQRKRAHTANS
jgi:hypothetical protein